MATATHAEALRDVTSGHNAMPKRSHRVKMEYSHMISENFETAEPKSYLESIASVLEN